MAPNKIGKTFWASAIFVSWALGYQPWDGQPSTLGIKPPVDLRITGEDFRHHLGRTVVPALEHWAPEGSYTTKKNSHSVKYLWEFKNGSVIELMTHDQDISLFESWMGHGWWPDEPPKQNIFTGMSRGLFSKGGKVLIPVTPLKEDWMLDDLVLSGRRDVGLLDGLTILDNDVLFNEDVAFLSQFLDGQQIEHYFSILLYVDDRGIKAEKFLEENIPLEQHDNFKSLKILRFVKDTPLEEKDSRLFGQFKQMAGKVIKDFNLSTQMVKNFEVPTNWPVVAMIDYHPAIQQAISFYAAGDAGRHFAIDEVFENMSPKGVAELIIRKKKVNCWNIKEAYIDPLALGDQAFVRNRMGVVSSAFEIIQNRLSDEDIDLYPASKDVTSGVWNIRDLCLSQNQVTSLYFMERCELHKKQILRWVYGPDGKPDTSKRHFMENLRRYTQVGNELSEQSVGGSFFSSAGSSNSSGQGGKNWLTV
jgi:hypothetical protein